ncbi:MAG: hypothetical protein ABSA30_12425, partial [Candidatus Aminicenantales bacterium]
PAAEDAAVTERFRKAGLPLIGKTATPEFGWKALTDSPLYIRILTQVLPSLRAQLEALLRTQRVAALMFSTMSLARTGLDEHEQFLASIRSYKPIFTKWINSRSMKSINFATGEMGKVELGDMPQHKFEPESLSKSLARTLPDFGLMVVLIIVFFAGAYVSFLKYDVR